MVKLLGRDTELAQIETALTAGLQQKVARALRIVGAAGIGKTALLAAAEDQAREGGWLVARVDAHRIQGTLPLVAARRMGDALLEALGEDAPRYAGGLPVGPEHRDAEPAAFREGVVRLAEGILHDYALLVSVDDGQWIDPESRALIEELLRSFSDRNVALLVTERAEERSAFAEFADAVRLAPVPADAGAALVRTHYPDAPAEVVDGILQHAKGLPLDLVALAQAARAAGVRDAEGVHASVRTAIAGRVEQLPPALREFLQLCSLIAEPIDYNTLSRIWPEQTVLEHIDAASGDYLVQDGTALRFVHSAIAESVRQTMAVEIPYRRKILAALCAIETPTLEEYERIIGQALACGDKALAHKHLLLLAQQATRESALFTASNAYERAFGIATPAPGDLVRIYLEYASVLNMQGRMVESAAVLQRALADTAAYNIKDGTGAIAALFLVAQWGTKGYRAALESAQPLLRRFKAREDREQLLSVTAWLHACADDPQNFERARSELLENGAELAHELRMRLSVAQAHLAVHRGDAQAATLAVESAVAEAGSVLSANRRSAEVSRAMIHFLSSGPRDIESVLPLLRIQRSPDRTQVPLIEYLRALCAFARGEFADAQELLREALGRPLDRHSRQRLLGIAAAIGALTGTPPAHGELIEEALAGFSGSAADAVAVPLASWHALSISLTEPGEARALVAEIFDALAAPGEISTLNFPVALALAAAQLKDRALLERASAMTGVWEDRAPWMAAQWNLAMGFAARALGKSSAPNLLEQAQAAFAAFDAPLFGAMAKTGATPGDREAAAFLNACGVRAALLQLRGAGESGTAETRRKGTTVPSRREMEIIALVADGQTNRAIAETLFLSERTVEGHIASVFNKLDVSSRTQIAAWYLTAQVNDRLPRAPSQTRSRTV